MAITCDESVLTGADGLVEFAPAGTSFCLETVDFPAGTIVLLPASNQYKIGDPIGFVETGTATLDTAIGGSGAVLTVLSVGPTGVSLDDPASPGNPLTLNGDTVAAGANHIEVLFGATLPVCSVQDWSLSLSKETTDVTTLPCSIGSGGAKVAPVRKQQGTFLNGEGTMNIMMTADQSSMGQRLLGNSVLTNSKVYAKLYVNAVASGFGGLVDDASSSYFEGSVQLLGFSISVNTSDAVVAEVSFSLAEQPKTLFGVTL